MNATKFTFAVESLRKFTDPQDPARARYFAVVETKNLPVDFPLETNPREQNLNSRVAKKIRDSFLSETSGQLFHLLNRGLLISAASVSFDNQKDEITIAMTNNQTHGVVDGGQNQTLVTEPRFVTLEIMTGVEDDFEAGHWEGLYNYVAATYLTRETAS